MKIKALSLILASLFCVLLVASCGMGGTDTDGEQKELGTLFSYSEGLEYDVNEKNPQTCTITGIGTCTDKTVKIPTSIDGKMVTAVAPNAFAVNEGTASPAPRKLSRQSASRTALESTDISNPDTFFKPSVNTEEQNEVLLELEGVVFPLTVKEIGEEAFLGCESLEEITTTQSITSIGKDAFKDTAYYNNESNWENHALYLQSYLITVDSSYTGEFTVKYGTTGIADQAFYQCVNVTGVNLAESVTYTGSYTFYGCANLTYVNGSAGLTFGTGAFDGCISYKDFVPGFGENGSDQQPNEPGEDEPLYDSLTKEIFDAVKASRYDNYTAVTMHGADVRETYKSNGNQYYFTRENNGELVREMYADTDENGLVNYLKVDGKWHFTTADIEMSPYIPDELEFEMLIVINEENNLYGYCSPENPDMRIEIGIKSGKLIYLCYQATDYQPTLTKPLSTAIHTRTSCRALLMQTARNYKPPKKTSSRSFCLFDKGSSNRNMRFGVLF